MASQGANKKPRFLSLYCILILFYLYNNAVTVKMLGPRTQNIRKRSLHSKREESKVDAPVDGGQPVTRNFVSKFEEIITSDVDSNQTAKFAALLLKQGKIYCRASQREHLSRGRHFVQMLQRGLEEERHVSASSLKYDLPILLKHDDSSGCHPESRTDV